MLWKQIFLTFKSDSHCQSEDDKAVHWSETNTKKSLSKKKRKKTYDRLTDEELQVLMTVRGRYSVGVGEGNVLPVVPRSKSGWRYVDCCSAAYTDPQTNIQILGMAYTDPQKGIQWYAAIMLLLFQRHMTVCAAWDCYGTERLLDGYCSLMNMQI